MNRVLSLVFAILLLDCRANEEPCATAFAQPKDPSQVIQLLGDNHNHMLAANILAVQEDINVALHCIIFSSDRAGRKYIPVIQNDIPLQIDSYLNVERDSEAFGTYRNKVIFFHSKLQSNEFEYQLYTTLVHEIGHILGIRHIPDNRLMNPFGHDQTLTHKEAVQILVELVIAHNVSPCERTEEE